MIELIITSPRFMAFLIASLILAITPGPGVVYIITRTLGYGRNAGLSSVGGIALGNLGNSAAASAGLAAVLAASSTAFAVIKFAGAAYLIYLGFNTLRTNSSAEGPVIKAGFSSSQHFRAGFVVALLNPKTALFFAALLPQFISSAAPPLSQSLFLGCVFVLIAMCTDSLYVLTATALGRRIGQRSKSQSAGKYVAAATFFGLGAYAAFVDSRHVK
jgi:threonine/homoserine/homoserine lactone efflux protein